MEDNKEPNLQSANGYLVSAALALVVFWVLGILKAAFPGIKSLLNFYPPIGPLLGLFTVSLIAFVLFVSIFQVVKIRDQAFAFWFFVISTILFAFMVFPPIFEPIAHALGG